MNDFCVFGVFSRFFFKIYFHYNAVQLCRGERESGCNAIIMIYWTYTMCVHSCVHIFFFQIFGFLSKRFQYWLKKESIRYRTFTTIKILTKRVCVYVIVYATERLNVFIFGVKSFLIWWFGFLDLFFEIIWLISMCE